MTPDDNFEPGRDAQYLETNGLLALATANEVVRATLWPAKRQPMGASYAYAFCKSIEVTLLNGVVCIEVRF
jgi:hypothetical protein